MIEDPPERFAELGVAIHENVPTVRQEPVVTIRQIPRHLFHPVGIRVRSASGEADTPRSDFENEENVERDQTTLRPGIDGGEIDGSEHVAMDTDELLPGHRSPALRRGIDSVFREDAADRCVGDVESEVRQSALDSVVAPAAILAGHLQNQFDDLGRNRRPA